ncbi:transcriptional regulator [Thaumarchaeota archaeon SCGC AB-539-E09]|nr:transcriptional regulator [Thaumarchaeota archaeon SCGC AB-539-E09]
MVEPFHRVCTNCCTEFGLNGFPLKCSRCGGTLEYALDPEYLKNVTFSDLLTFWKYRPVMPSVPRPVSLGEGGTPLWRADRLGKHLRLKHLTLKDETRNPTNSFKDRSASLLISDATGKGFDSIISASSGNHGAALSAYSAKEDIDCHVIVPNDLDLGKLAQMMVYNADVTESGGPIEKAINLAMGLEERRGWYQATTELNPLSIEALKTISYEISEQGEMPDWMVVAMGSGVTIHAVWKGFHELELMGRIEEKPRLIGVQASGCSPITDAFTEKRELLGESSTLDTIALAIKNYKPRFGTPALMAIKESDGLAVAVSDDEMLRFGKEIARSEGIFPEPASAATVACLPPLLNQGIITKSESVVCLITSSGLKTDDILTSLNKRHRSLGLNAKIATKERLLLEISKNDSYGYALWDALGRNITLGAVYQHISDLETGGLVTSYRSGRRRYLSITEKGLKVLSAMDDLRTLL